jgi:hypothetical protein
MPLRRFYGAPQIKQARALIGRPLGDPEQSPGVGPTDLLPIVLAAWSFWVIGSLPRS